MRRLARPFAFGPTHRPPSLLEVVMTFRTAAASMALVLFAGCSTTTSTRQVGPTNGSSTEQCGFFVVEQKKTERFLGIAVSTKTTRHTENLYYCCGNASVDAVCVKAKWKDTSSPLLQTEAPQTPSPRTERPACGAG